MPRGAHDISLSLPWLLCDIRSFIRSPWADLSDVTTYIRSTFAAERWTGFCFQWVLICIFRCTVGEKFSSLHTLGLQVRKINLKAHLY